MGDNAPGGACWAAGSTSSSADVMWEGVTLAQPTPSRNAKVARPARSPLTPLTPNSALARTRADETNAQINKAVSADMAAFLRQRRAATAIQRLFRGHHLRAFLQHGENGATIEGEDMSARVHRLEDKMDLMLDYLKEEQRKTRKGHSSKALRYKGRALKYSIK